jgi:hypothetical protein
MLPAGPGVLEVLEVQVALEVLEAPEAGGLVVAEVSVVGLEIDSLMSHH